MRVRRKLRRVERFACLGLLTGTVIAVRRLRTPRPADDHRLGAPSTWPPLEPSPESPVAAVGELVQEAGGDELAPPPAAGASPEEPASDGGGSEP